MEIKLSPAQAAKREVVEQLKEKIKSCQSFVVLDYKGLTVAKDTEFRNELRKNGVEYKVYNTAVQLRKQVYGFAVANDLYASFNALVKEKNVLTIDQTNTILKNIIENSGVKHIRKATQ